MMRENKHPPIYPPNPACLPVPGVTLTVFHGRSGDRDQNSLSGKIRFTVGLLIRAATGNRVFRDLAPQEAAIEDALRPPWKEPRRVRQLVGAGWIRSQVNDCSD